MDTYTGTLDTVLRRFMEIQQSLDTIIGDLESADGMTDNGHHQQQIRMMVDRLRGARGEITYAAEETIALLPEEIRTSNPMARAWNEAYGGEAKA